MKNRNRQGSVHSVVIISLVAALVFALGWIFWQNFIHKEPVKKETEVIKVDNEDEQPAEMESAAAYIDYRNDKKEDGSGVKLQSTDDFSKLKSVDQSLKDYFSKKLGTTVETMGGKMKAEYIVDRTYGSYAVGGDNFTGAYQIWGPKNSSGDVTMVASTQNAGFSCDELEAAKVSSELVDGKCLRFKDDGSEATEETYVNE